MNRRLEVRLRDSRGDSYAPTAMEPIGDVAGGGFMTEFHFGGTFGPNGSNSFSKSSGTTQGASSRFKCTFPALGEKAELAKIDCTVITATGDPKIAPFEFKNIVVAE